MSSTFLAVQAVWELLDCRSFDTKQLSKLLFLDDLELPMGRAPRADAAGGIYHALNRGNAKNPFFFKDEDYEAFERIIAEGLEKFPIELIAYQWLNNHWHMVLSPHEDGGMGRFLGWVTLTHTQRYHAHHGTTGWGHVYQGRFKSFPVQDDDHFHVVCRYVERNALTAKLVKRAARRFNRHQNRFLLAAKFLCFIVFFVAIFDSRTQTSKKLTFVLLFLGN